MTGIGRRAFVGGLAIAPALSIAGAAEAAIQPRPVGNVATVRGTAFAERGADNVSLYEQAPLLLQDLVRTAPDSRCALRFGEATTVNLGENAKLRIERFIVSAGRVLTLESGSVLVDKSEQSRGQRLLLNSPYALIAIRGTAYFAGLLPDGFGVFVERGTVRVRGNSKWVTLTAGEGTRIPQPGAEPEKPIVWGQRKIDLSRAMIR